ncbi:MAG: alpha/beta fold hydrolase [Actinomycetota bacterium]
MDLQVVLVHGIRTSRTMWKSQLAYLRERGAQATAIDLPGHGVRRDEPFTLESAFDTIDAAVRDAATRGPVLLVGHSLGGLLTIAYAGAENPPPLAGLVAASATSLPRGAGLSAYRLLARAFNALPDRGQWITGQVLAATLPPDTRHDFAAGGYAFHTQDTALRSLASLDLTTAVQRIRIPLWFVNGQYDQLRTHETLFRRLAPDAEFLIVPRTTHLVTAMRPAVFNALLGVAAATVERNAREGS